MSKWAILISVPQVLVCFGAAFYAFRAHMFGGCIYVKLPGVAVRLCNLAHGVVFLTLAYVLIQAYWALDKPLDYEPSLSDAIANTWDLLVLVHLLVWCIHAVESARERLGLLDAKPCRPCPWRGEAGQIVSASCGEFFTTELEPETEPAPAMNGESQTANPRG